MERLFDIIIALIVAAVVLWLLGFVIPEPVPALVALAIFLYLVFMQPLGGYMGRRRIR
jgi:uncharacterized membrane protein YccC